MFNSLFDPDSAFSTFVNRLIDLVILNIIFIVCCLPVITMGPACSALYYSVVKSIRQQRSYCVREFFREFRASLKKGILVHLILMALTFLSLRTDVPLMLSFFEAGTMDNILPGLLFICKILIPLGITCWIYPLMSRYEQGPLLCFQWALHLMLKHIPRTLYCIVIVFISVFLFWLEPLLIALIPSVMTLLVSIFTEPVLRGIAVKEDHPD